MVTEPFVPLTGLVEGRDRDWDRHETEMEIEIKMIEIEREW